MCETTFAVRPSGLAVRPAPPVPAQRYAAVCRGSANPAAMAWLAERLGLAAGNTVVDLGAGLGGPAGWLSERYGCRVLTVEPVRRATGGASGGPGRPVLVGSADRVPPADDVADAALLLGVLSVRGELARSALAEACRLAPALGVLDYCSTGGSTVFVGGGRFRPAGAVLAEVAATGWVIDRSCPAVGVPPPGRQALLARLDPSAAADSADIVDAIERGDLAPLLFVAHRADGHGGTEAPKRRSAEASG